MKNIMQFVNFAYDSRNSNGKNCWVYDVSLNSIPESITHENKVFNLYLNDRLNRTAYYSNDGEDYEVNLIYKFPYVMERRFEHDCESCLFLGQYKEYDLYICLGTNHTPIARYGEKGDYLSGMSFWDVPCLQEAIKRASDLHVIDLNDVFVISLMERFPEAKEYLIDNK
jgi:hypothetical protein